MSGRTHTTGISDTPAILFRRYQQQLRQQVRAIVRTSRENVDDACSFAWFQLLRHEPDPETVYGWLVTVAVREAIKLDRRSRRTEPFVLDKTGVPIEPPDPRREHRVLDELLVAGELIDRARLTDREREILALQVLGYSYEEIATAVSATVRTVERQLLRARRKLRHELERERG